MMLKRFAWNVLYAICLLKNNINLGKHWLACPSSNALILNPQMLMASWSLPLDFSKWQNTFFTHFAWISSFLDWHLTQRTLSVWPRIPRTSLLTRKQEIRREENSTIVILFGEYWIISGHLSFIATNKHCVLIPPVAANIVTLHCIFTLFSWIVKFTAVDIKFLLCGLVRADVCTQGSYKPKIVLEEHLVDLWTSLYRGVSQVLVSYRRESLLCTIQVLQGY